MKNALILLTLVLLFAVPAFGDDDPVTAPVFDPPAAGLPGESGAGPGSGEQPAVPGANPPRNADPVEQMTDIHDIKPPEPAGFDYSKLIYAGYAVIAIIVLAALIYLVMRFKRGKKPVVEILPEPHERAHLLLDELMDVELIDGKDFYFRLSAILRGYMKGGFGINAPEMTTEELAPRIEKLEIDPKLKHDLKAFLNSAEPIKYADVYAVEKKMQNDLSLIRKFVKRTAPRISDESETDNATGN